MKRKLLVIALAFVMIFASSVTALATTDEVVGNIYDAYSLLKTGTEELCAQDIKAGVEACEEFYDVIGDIDANQAVELGNLMGLGEACESEIVVGEFYELYKTSEMFVELWDTYSLFFENPSLENAEEFIATYDNTFEHEEIGEAARNLMEDVEGITLENEIDNAREVIALAEMENQQNQKVNNIYNSFNGLYGTLKYAGDAVIQQAIEAFPQVLADMENLTDEELVELASLLGVADGEEAKALVYSEWESICAYLELGRAAAAFSADNTVENAQALVSCYEKATASEQISALVAENYASVAEVKAAADDVLAEAAKNEESKEEEPKEEEQTQEEPKEENKEDAKPEEPKEEKPSHDVPKTGDNSLIYPLLMILSAGAFIFLKKSGSINK